MKYNTGCTLLDQRYKEGEPTWGCKFGVLDVKDFKDYVKQIEEMLRTWHIEISERNLIISEINRLAGTQSD